MLYTAGLAAAHMAEVEYADNDRGRLTIVASFGARVRAVSKRGSAGGRSGYDLVVETASNTRGLRDGLHALAPAGCVSAPAIASAPTQGCP
ncbi:hypothetical protein NOU13_32200 [Rhodococcus erythropolis]|uniref:hypothetical protein n=1 Tax=Rhodococcus erythropolis TaxID=1833 RepID=UPI00210C877A|nr:hypothetical protein [Rhodococcus erythropolis]MCQ4129169.1 hypothetical protein [Rhodococcus erythropolis]